MVKGRSAYFPHPQSFKSFFFSSFFLICLVQKQKWSRPTTYSPAEQTPASLSVSELSYLTAKKDTKHDLFT